MINFSEYYENIEKNINYQFNDKEQMEAIFQISNLKTEEIGYVIKKAKEIFNNYINYALLKELFILSNVPLDFKKDSFEKFYENITTNVITEKYLISKLDSLDLYKHIVNEDGEDFYQGSLANEEKMNMIYQFLLNINIDSNYQKDKVNDFIEKNFNVSNLLYNFLISKKIIMEVEEKQIVKSEHDKEIEKEKTNTVVNKLDEELKLNCVDKMRLSGDFIEVYLNIKDIYRDFNNGDLIDTLVKLHVLNPVQINYINLSSEVECNCYIPEIGISIKEKGITDEIARKKLSDKLFNLINEYLDKNKRIDIDNTANGNFITKNFKINTKHKLEIFESPVNNFEDINLSNEFITKYKKLMSLYEGKINKFKKDALNILENQALIKPVAFFSRQFFKKILYYYVIPEFGINFMICVSNPDEANLKISNVLYMVLSEKIEIKGVEKQTVDLTLDNNIDKFLKKIKKLPKEIDKDNFLNDLILNNIIKNDEIEVDYLSNNKVSTTIVLKDVGETIKVTSKSSYENSIALNKELYRILIEKTENNHMDMPNQFISYKNKQLNKSGKKSIRQFFRESIILKCKKETVIKIQNEFNNIIDIFKFLLEQKNITICKILTYQIVENNIAICKFIIDNHSISIYSKNINDLLYDLNVQLLKLLKE